MRSQRVVLNGQASTWTNIATGIPQDSILGPLMVLIYVNDLSANDTSLFSVIYDSQTSANVLNKASERLQNWAFQWKMNLNPDPTKQAQEVIFSRKIKKLPHLPLVFNNTNVTQSIYEKNLGVILDPKLTFENHINMVTTKIIRLLYSLVNYKTYYQEPP